MLVSIVGGSAVAFGVRDVHGEDVPIDGVPYEAVVVLVPRLHVADPSGAAWADRSGCQLPELLFVESPHCLLREGAVSLCLSQGVSRVGCGRRVARAGALFACSYSSS